MSAEREKVYSEMKEMFGLVPSFMKTIPDDTLAAEWEIMKKVQLGEGVIPNKYREMMGIALSAVSKCKYCSLFHTEMARLHGATEEEIEAVNHYAKSSAGWSTYINGMQVDYETFKKEIRSICDFVRAAEKKAA